MVVLSCPITLLLLKIISLKTDLNWISLDLSKATLSGMTLKNCLINIKPLEIHITYSPLTIVPDARRKLKQNSVVLSTIASEIQTFIPTDLAITAPKLQRWRGSSLWLGSQEGRSTRWRKPHQHPIRMKPWLCINLRKLFHLSCEIRAKMGWNKSQVGKVWEFPSKTSNL